MIKKSSEEPNIVCSQARKRFAALEEESTHHEMSGSAERAVIRRHLQACSRCAREYRLFALQRSTLAAAAAPEPIAPDEDFFRALRARIARGPEVLPLRPLDESWTAAMLLTARQLIPAMAMLLLLILGATLLWDQPSYNTNQAAVLRPRERVMFSDVTDLYEYPAPTREDVLDTLVAVEEKENGK